MNNKRLLPFSISVFISVINGILLFTNYLLGLHLVSTLVDNTLDINIYKKLYYKIYIIISVLIGIFIILSMAAFLIINKNTNPSDELKQEKYLYEGFMITNIVIFNLSFIIVAFISLNINFTNKK